MTVPYRIVTVYFDPGPSGRYDLVRLLRVYQASALACGQPLEVVGINTPTRPSKYRWMSENTAKLVVWRDIIKQATTPVILTDADMMMMSSDFEPIFDGDYDIGYTKRTKCPTIPLNGGVVVVKPTPEAIKFMDAWVAVNERMMREPGFHSPWRKKYAGMNQASLGYLLEHPRTKAKVQALSCRLWNAVDDDWNYCLTEGSRLIHIKGTLRRAALKEWRPAKVDRPPAMDILQGEAMKLALKWQEYDAWFDHKQVWHCIKPEELMEQLEIWRKIGEERVCQKVL